MLVIRESAFALLGANVSLLLHMLHPPVFMIALAWPGGKEAR